MYKLSENFSRKRFFIIKSEKMQSECTKLRLKQK